MTKARDISSLIGSSGQIDNAKITLDANEIPALDTAKITTGTFDASRIGSGTFADARISASSVSQHATSFDDNKIVNDISTLALRQSSDANRSAYNTNSQFVDVFQDDTGIDTITNSFRNSDEYVSSIEQINKLIVTKWEYYGDANVPATWNIQGSNDNSTWTTLYTGLNMNVGSSGWRSTGTFSNTTAYRYYRSYKTNGASVGNYHRELRIFDENNSQITLTSSRLSKTGSYDLNATGLVDGNTSTAGFHTDGAGVGSTLEIDLYNISLTVNATGNFTGTTITAPSSVSSMGAIITYQDNAGTNALNTDIVLELSADNGSNWSTATLSALPNFATGIKMAKVNDLAVTAGTQLKYRINFANQASGSKEARIRGVALQY